MQKRRRPRATQNHWPKGKKSLIGGGENKASKIASPHKSLSHTANTPFDARSDGCSLWGASPWIRQDEDMCKRTWTENE